MKYNIDVNKLTVKQLKKFVKHYNTDMTMAEISRTYKNKSELVEAVNSYLFPALPEAKEREEEVQMSVRVRRAKESVK